jgi:hypothetical protein
MIDFGLGNVFDALARAHNESAETAPESITIVGNQSRPRPPNTSTIPPTSIQPIKPNKKLLFIPLAGLGLVSIIIYLEQSHGGRKKTTPNHA